MQTFNTTSHKEQIVKNSILTNRETSVLRAELVMENVDDAIFLIESGTLKCIYLNAEAKNITGYSDNDIGKITCMDTMPQVSLPDFADKINPILEGEKNSVTIETTYHKKDGTLLPVEIKFHRMEEENGKDYFISIARDISDRKKAKLELERSNSELINFAYAASHDLKAPLRAISQLSTWIQEDIAETCNDDTKRNLELMRSRIERMDNLLNGLLAYSRVGRVEGNISTIHMKDLIKDILFLLDTPSNFSIIFSDIISEIKSLKVPLEQVLRNLISNAIKYHDKKNGVIEITMREKESWYEFTISDNGPGIAPQHHQKIFEMFQRLISKDEIEGSGMGLALVKKTIENYKGIISVESELGAGTLFRFTWPKNISGEEQ